jgi:hypothetical protein
MYCNPKQTYYWINIAAFTPLDVGKLIAEPCKYCVFSLFYHFFVLIWFIIGCVHSNNNHNKITIHKKKEKNPEVGLCQFCASISTVLLLYSASYLVSIINQTVWLLALGSSRTWSSIIFVVFYCKFLLKGKRTYTGSRSLL